MTRASKHDEAHPDREVEVPRVEPDSTHWLVRPSTIRKLWIAMAIVLFLTVIPDFFLEHHPYFGFDGLPGFSAAFGFVACVFMVILSKVLGIFLKRTDRYYGD
ncbi:MAG: hypothetical protein WEG36_10005 [Gemmatimonadota bacterium]